MQVILGIIAGALLGAIGGEGRGLLVGAIVGAALGFAFRAIANLRSRPGAPDSVEKIAHIYAALADIHRRLTVLEQATGLSAGKPDDAIQPAPPEAVLPSAEVSAAPTLVPAAIELPPESAARPAVPEPSAEPTSAAVPPHKPNFIAAWFTGGNTLVRVGAIILFFGVAFLLKYAAEHSQLSIEARLIGVAIGAMVLLGIGWRLREGRRAYALAIQGTGVGVLYLLVFAALRIYHVLPPAAGFALLVAIAVFSAILAVTQDALALAAIGVTGGFLAPILASSGSGNHVLLFSYFAVLNAGIVGIAWFRVWRVLNVLGLVFTALAGTMWAMGAYDPDKFATTEPFVVAFFLFYVAIAVLYALRQSVELKNVVDGTLVFGTPLIAFGWQAGLLRDQHYALAASAIVAAALYLALARLLLARARPGLQLAIESFIALGIVFATLAIPLALDARWTSAAWALEGAAIVWIGLRQQRVLARVFGMALQIAAVVAFANAADFALQDRPLLNAFYIGTFFIAMGALGVAWLLDRYSNATRDWERVLAALFFFWGLGWWLFGGGHEIDRFVSKNYDTSVLIAFLTATAAAYSFSVRPGGWDRARWPVRGLVLALVLVAAVSANYLAHPAEDGGWLAWPLAFVMQYALLRRHEDGNAWIVSASHCLTLWLGAALLSWQLSWAVAQIVDSGVWHTLAWGLVPTIVVLVIVHAGEHIAWPVRRHRSTYLGVGAGVLAAYLLAWTIYANFTSDANAAPLSYVPLLNPLDLALVFALLVVTTWLRHAQAIELGTSALEWRRLAAMALGAASFIWLTAVVLRTVHHWAHVPLNVHAMMHSMLAQSALSVFWALLALATMVIAVRGARRSVWIAGAVLLAIVVLKLFVIDLSNIGGVERIVSFIGVGVLLLAVGYFAPVPPRAAAGGGESAT